MKKLLLFLDNNILRFSIAFSILFIPLYPKVPSIGISHVWVYVRLEDFLILLVSFIYCLLFVGPHLQNFFPLVATLEYFRRIEYMILFFAAFSSIKKKSDIN